MLPIATYAVYLVIAIPLTVWVATTLHRHGRLFLIEAFQGKTEVADAVNMLLVVGFYLINLGFIALFLRFGDKPQTAVEALEYIATKIGIVLLVLGCMHFFNVFNFAKMRGKALRHATP